MPGLFAFFVLGCANAQTQLNHSGASLATTTAAPTHADSISVQGFNYTFRCNRETLTRDFLERDALAQTNVPQANWYARDADGDFINGGWGPRPIHYPQVNVPGDAGCDAAAWQRERILAVALRYLNVPENPHALDYRHHHIPAWSPPTNTHSSMDDGNPQVNDLGAWAKGTGLDCSNFVSWVYNFGLGIKFTSSVRDLYGKSLGIEAEPLAANGPFQLGDLIYLHPNNSNEYASHVVIYLDDKHVLDSRYDALSADGNTKRGAQIRLRQGWYRNAALGGWRIIQ